MKIISLLKPAALYGLVIALCPAAGAQAQDTAPAVQPPEQDCSMSSARSRAGHLAQALQKGFGVQYWGETYDAETLSRHPHGFLILEVTKIGAPYSDTGHEVFFTPQELAMINREKTRPVVGYLNVSEIETYRNYWIDQGAASEDAPAKPQPDWSGPKAAQGDHLAAYWTEGWHDLLMSRVDALMQTGIDGLFLDDVLHYYTHALDDTLEWPEGQRPDGPTDAPGLALEMMRLVQAIAARARQWDCNAYIVVNNGVFIGRDAAGATPEAEARAAFATYLDAIDAIMLENVSDPATHPHTIAALQEDYRDQGVAVLALDIASRFPDRDPAALRQLVAEKAVESKFYPYVASDHAFNQVSPPIPRP